MLSNKICRNPYYDSGALYKDLCFKKDFNNGFNEEPFQLYIKPKKFYCAQIPGLQANETSIVDNSIEYPEAFCVIIEIVIYQRLYSKNLLHLLSEINKIILQNPKYNNFTKSFVPKFTLICKGHRNLSQQIDQIALSQPSSNTISNFSSSIIKNIDFLAQLQDFNEEVKKNENSLLDISLENSMKDPLGFNQITIFQILRSSKAWLLFYVQSIKKIGSFFPEDHSNYRQSIEISKALQCFLNKM